MTIWSDQLDSIYASPIASECTLVPGTGGVPVLIKAIDKTVGVEVFNDSVAGMTIRPAAYLRMSDVTSNGLTRGDLDQGTLTISDKTWRIVSHLLRPNPDGELKGEVCVLLMDEDV